MRNRLRLDTAGHTGCLLGRSLPFSGLHAKRRLPLLFRDRRISSFLTDQPALFSLLFTNVAGVIEIIAAVTYERKKRFLRKKKRKNYQRQDHNDIGTDHTEAFSEQQNQYSSDDSASGVVS